LFPRPERQRTSGPEVSRGTFICLSVSGVTPPSSSSGEALSRHQPSEVREDAVLHHGYLGPPTSRFSFRTWASRPSRRVLGWAFGPWSRASSTGRGPLCVAIGVLGGPGAQQPPLVLWPSIRRRVCRAGRARRGPCGGNPLRTVRGAWPTVSTIRAWPSASSAPPPGAPPRRGPANGERMATPRISAIAVVTSARTPHVLRARFSVALQARPDRGRWGRGGRGAMSGLSGGHAPSTRRPHLPVDDGRRPLSSWCEPLGARQPTTPLHSRTGGRPNAWTTRERFSTWEEL